MYRSMVIGILVVALIGAGVWGYKEHKDKNTVMIQAENNYQQSYNQLTSYVDQLHNKLGTTLAVKSADAMRPQLVDVWRLATLAHNTVGQLPLTLMPFNKTNDFLVNVGQYTYQKAVKNNNNQPLSSKDYQTVEKLYKQSGKVEDGLKGVQQNIMTNKLKWMDVQQALAAQNQSQDNQIVDGLKSVEMKAGAFSNQWSPDMKQMNQTMALDYNKISGKIVSRSVAVKQVTNELNLKHVKVVNSQILGKGSAHSAYQLKLKATGHPSLLASVSRHGGRLLWFMQNRKVTAGKMSLNQGETSASAFIKKHGIQNMSVVKSDQYDHIAIFNYALQKNNVTVYPAMIRLKVALDTGEVLSYDQSEYLINQSIKTTDKPAISEQKARSSIHNKVTLQETRLAIINNEKGVNVLCYEFLGTKGNETYRIFINAKSGNLEKAELLQDH